MRAQARQQEGAKALADEFLNSLMYSVVAPPALQEQQQQLQLQVNNVSATQAVAVEEVAPVINRPLDLFKAIFEGGDDDESEGEEEAPVGPAASAPTQPASDVAGAGNGVVTAGRGSRWAPQEPSRVSTTPVNLHFPYSHH